MPTGPQRLILIGSGCYDYAEVELAGALQIVGPNNTGKTTLINTLQFLYIDDRRHMDFGSYSPDQTREFYFPNQYSYLLFECLGATGKCVIGWRGKSKASGDEPERFIHMGPFDVTDFLDGNNQVREPRDVNARLALKEFRAIKNAQEHRELLLPAANGEARGLAIVALRDTDKYHQFRETLKNLLTLSAISQEQMRDRLLMLADIPPDRNALDARQVFGDDYDRIRHRRQQLLKFKANQTLVEELVNRFAERETVRGELGWRWTDLRTKQQAFEQENGERLANLRVAKTTREKEVADLEAELVEHRKAVEAMAEQKGQLVAPLKTMEAQDQQFKGFPEELERGAVANLREEIRKFDTQLVNADNESHDKAKQKVAFFTDRVSEKERTVKRFDNIAVTALRKHFGDDQLNSIFRVLSRDLLETPVGHDGVVVASERELIAELRNILARIHGGVYRDTAVSFPLSQANEPLMGLENPEIARQTLADYRSELKRWKEILSAIEQREGLVAQRKATFAQVEEKERQLHRFEEYQRSKFNEPKLRAELKKAEDSIAATQKRIADISLRLKAAETAKTDAETAMRKQEADFENTMTEFRQCHFPEFPSKPDIAESVPDDFGAAVAIYIRQQDKQSRLTEIVENLLARTDQCFSDEFRGADDYETVSALQAELEALVEKEEALARDWNAHIHGLRATFDLILRNLDHVLTAATEINRAFAKIQVSNLKAVKLEVIKQTEMVSWIERLAAFDPGGLFDPNSQQESAMANFRRRLQDNPIIRFADLFTLGFIVVGADGQRHSYHDFRQIESHGTTITIKVLFNLLVLENQLRRDHCAVPFFLDEIQALDPANRQAILHTAEQLGFIAITAAPQAISEVDALYFLQPQAGRIILRQKHRIAVKRASTPREQ